MKAIVYTKYGSPDVLELKEVEKPTPKNNEVLIKVCASTVTPMDYRFRNGRTVIARFMTGLLKPKIGYHILGVELAGEIEAAGKDVKLFEEGDQVYGLGRPGAHADYTCMPEDKVVMKPSNMTYEEAAAVPFGAGSALRFLKDYGHIQKGQKGKENKMQELPLVSRVGLYVLLGIMGFICLIVWVWQIRVLKGKAMKNPDGSLDSWHKQKTHYGIAFADVFVACPLNIAGIVFVFISPKWGYYLLAMVSFWWVWANTMTTTTSLRFWKPSINLTWIIAYPFGILIGLAYIVWTVIHFDTIYSL